MSANTSTFKIAAPSVKTAPAIIKKKEFDIKYAKNIMVPTITE